MKSYHIKRVTLGNARGGVLVLVTMLLVVLIGVAALAVDIGHLATTRNELQNVADAAALAGAGKLGTVYMDLTAAEIPGHTFERSDIVPVVQAVALQNRVSGLNVVIYDTATDIRIGIWNPPDIAPETLVEPDAVYVKVRRDDNDPTSPTRKITTFFAGIFGIDTMSVTAEAIAALSGPSIIAEGELQLPVGLADNVFLYPDTLCTDLITFSPTPSSCAAWHNFEDSINGDAMEDKIIGIIEGHTVKSDDCDACGELFSGLDWMEANFDVAHNPQYPGSIVTPSYNVGTFFEFQGGQISKLLTPGAGYLTPDDPLVYDPNNYDTGTNPGNEGAVTGKTDNPQDMTALFDYFRYRDGDDDILYENDVFAADGTRLHAAGDIEYASNDVWSTTIPVYDDPTPQVSGATSPACGNATGSKKIVGFAEVQVLKTNPPPDTTLAVRVKCGLSVAEGRGGGGGFSSILGSVPSLVK